MVSQSESPARLRATYWLALAAVFCAFVALRLYHGGAPLVDDSAWRQVDTASEAWFFIHKGLGPLPQLFYNGPGPNYVQLEFPFLPLTVALLSHVFPFGSWLLHGVATAYSTLSLLFLWLFVRRVLGPQVALWAAAVFAVQPLGIFFGRAFQPEPAMVAGTMAALWLTARYADRGGRLNYLLAVAAFTFAVAAKLPASLASPAVFLLALRRDRILSPRPWLLLAVPALAAGGYTLWAGTMVSPGYNFVVIILQLLQHKSYHVGIASVPQFWYHFLLETCITGAGALPLALGLVAVPPLRRASWFWGWAAGLLLWCLVVVRHIRFEYYLVPLLPWLAIAEGAGLEQLVRWCGGTRLAAFGAAAFVLAGSLLFSLRPLSELYTLDMYSYHAGTALRAALGPGPVILGTQSPVVLFYSRHHGWRTNSLTMAQLRTWRAAGAHYYIPVWSKQIPAVARYVRSHYLKRTAGPVVYYDLRRAP